MSVTVIDKYEVIETLGQGSMGVVYKAEDPTIGRMVAIKTLRSIYMGDDTAGNEALKRFRQEARSAGRLRHPNIVTIFEAGRTEGGSPYIVMEFIEGADLDAIIKDEAPLDPARALHYLVQIANAIDYAHSENVIHRDIKPSNVIVDTKHRPWLLDFGVAKLSDTSLTPAGTVVGTPSYMSPEQILGEAPHFATDNFSFAVMAFELFTGKRPFPGNDFTTVVNNIIHKEPITFAELGINLPRELEAIFRQGLAKDKEKRFSSAMLLVKAAADIFGISIESSGLVGGYDHSVQVAQMKNGHARDAQRENRISTDEELAVNATSIVNMANNTDQKYLSEPVINQKPATHSPKADKAKKITNNNLFTIIVVCLGFIAGAGYLMFADKSSQHKQEALVSDIENQIALAASSAKQLESKVIEMQAPLIESAKEVFEEKIAPVLVVDEPTVIEVKEELVEELLIPAQGFDADAVSVLTDSQINLLLQPSKVSLEELKLGIAEAGARDKLLFIEALNTLADHEDFKVRIEVIKALGRSSFKRGDRIMGIFGRKLNDTDFLVRGFTARIVGQMSNAQARELLNGRLELEQNQTVRKILEKELESQ